MQGFLIRILNAMKTKQSKNATNWDHSSRILMLNKTCLLLLFSQKQVVWEENSRCLSNYSLREKCLNTELYLARIFLHSDWIQRDTPYLSVFSPNTGKYGPEIAPYLVTFHAVIVSDDLTKIIKRTWCRNIQNYMQNELCIATKQFSVRTREPYDVQRIRQSNIVIISVIDLAKNNEK